MKIYQPRNIVVAKKLLLKTEAAKAGIELMAGKALGLAVDLGLHDCSIGNILKQEALSVGADAAVHEQTSRCAVPKTRIVLVGTLKQLLTLAQKLQKNVAELPKIGKELEIKLRNGFTY